MPRYHVYVSERGNVFMTEIAALLAASLTDLGHDTVYPAPGLPEGGHGRVNLVVAPHEFFTLQPDRREAELLAAAAASVTVGVEQPGTSWFDLGAHYASVARAILDISPFAVEELRRRGLEATHLQLGYHASWDRWGGDPSRPRSGDLLFLGSMTDRRECYLGMCAPFLWDRRCDFRLFEFPRPMSEPRAGFVVGEDKWELLAGNRILLNVHRNEVPYFEWVRVLEAVHNGCLVLSELSADYGPLEPGKHLVAAPPDTLGPYAASLLSDETLRAELSVAAYDLVRTKLELNQTMAGICEQLDRLAFPTSRPSVAPLPVAAPPPAEPPLRHPMLQDAFETEVTARTLIKELLVSETDVAQSIESMQARLRFGSADHVETFTTSAWEGCCPDVSVLITSYDYAHFVSDAIASAMASQEVGAEIVIVDDHSWDDSVPAIRTVMAEADWFPIKLLAKAANSGVSATRNLGFSHARADRVMVLDADNLLFPTALAKLSGALSGSPEASFAYGMIAKFGQPGMASYLPWDVERLAQSPYIDAMAMIRKSAWQEVGGYDEYSGRSGWEDYEFWLRMAGDLRSGAFVRELVAMYRVHATSRQTMVDLDVESLKAEFKARYPFLPWRSDDGR